MKKIPLSQGLFTIVDDTDYEWLNDYSWYYKDGHVVRNRLVEDGPGPSIISIQNEIWNKWFGRIPENKVVDHINRNGLFNVLSNLRLASRKENAWNASMGKNNTSGYIGVMYEERGNNQYWKAYMTDDKGKTYTKRFPFTEEGKIEAAHYYDALVKLFRGTEYAVFNFPEETPVKINLEDIDGSKSKGESGFWGLTKRKDGTEPRWRASIKDKKKKVHSKTFPFTEEGKIDAAKWYDKKAKELFGDEFKHFNFPDDILSDEEFEKLSKKKYKIKRKKLGKYDSRTKTVRIKETNQIFDSLTECAEFLNVNEATIRRSAQNNKKMKNGYTIEYI